MKRATQPPRALRGALAACMLAAGALLADAGGARAQTFAPERAIDTRVCTKVAVFFSKCQNIRTDRITRTFAQQQLGDPLFADTWSSAAHCTRVDGEEECSRSVSVASDPRWNRVVWGSTTSGQFMKSYGATGTADQGPGHFNRPLGVDITRNDGEWHVAFVADGLNDRIVVLAVGSSCLCVRWLGTIDAAETGTKLLFPHDVAWDPATTWSLADDRLFIADTGNDRIVVYRVSLNPAGGTMSAQYLGAFGSGGSGPAQLRGPKGIAVRSFGSLASDVFVSDTENRRVSVWYYDTNSSSVPASSPYPARQSAPMPGAELVGITLDHYGDVVVADRAQRRVVKVQPWDLSTVASYGGTYSWAYGDFNRPSDPQTIFSFTSDAYGGIVKRGLPFMQTTEGWTASSGGQLHQLGVDAANMQVSVYESGATRDATLSFLFTGVGQYSVVVKTAGGSVVRSWPVTSSSSGWRSVYWDGRNASGVQMSAGTYRFEVTHESGYDYDNGAPRTSGYSFTMGFSVFATVPGYVNNSAQYGLTGDATQAATDWVWERQDTYGYGNSYGWYTWDTQQYSSVVFYQDTQPYSVDWRVGATRTATGERGYGYGSTYVEIYESNCYPQIYCMQAPYNLIAGRDTGNVAAAGDTAASRTPAVPVRAKGALRMGGAPGAPAPDVATRRGHFGAGAWVGRPTAEGPQVVQLYSLAGKHESRGGDWPNALGGAAETVLENDPGTGRRMQARAAFRRLGGAGDREEYAVRFSAGQGAGLLGAGERTAGFVALALDPDLGARPGDDRLGVDEATGLVWVTDPDSGAVGYVLTDLPQGARASVRQFSSSRGFYRPDPPSDSAAYAELAAGQDSLTRQPGDVRFVLGVGSVELRREVVLGLVVLRAPTLDALRQAAATVPRTGMVDAARGEASRTGITRFHLAQAAPEPTRAGGVRSISPAEVPGLQRSAAPAPAAPSLRELVRAHGITALAFAVPDGEAVRVRVSVYDARGRMVRHLVDETQEPGAYRVQWDGADERGAKVAPGVYVAVMEAPGFRATTRLVVVP